MWSSFYELFLPLRFGSPLKSSLGLPTTLSASSLSVFWFHSPQSVSPGLCFVRGSASRSLSVCLSQTPHPSSVLSLSVFLLHSQSRRRYVVQGSLSLNLCKSVRLSVSVSLPPPPCLCLSFQCLALSLCQSVPLSVSVSPPPLSLSLPSQCLRLSFCFTPSLPFSLCQSFRLSVSVSPSSSPSLSLLPLLSICV